MDLKAIALFREAIAAPRHFKVNFVIAGTQKGGTTAFNNYLKSHPTICLPRKKEIRFFSTDRYFKAQCLLEYRFRYQHYHSFFQPQPQHRIAGEATPTYMYWVDAPRRIRQYNPQMKLIIILRNPITRAYSHWNMQREREFETLSFWDAIQQEPERQRATRPGQNKTFSYVDRGYYTEQLRRIWRFFPREQTLIFRSEELKEQPEAVLRKTYAFLGLDYVASSPPQASNTRTYPSRMEPREREYLQYLYEYEIKALERMLDWDCSDWLC